MANQHISLEEGREHLKEIVSRDEYERYRREQPALPEKESWLDRLLNWLEQLFPQIELPASSGNFFSYMIIVIAIGLLIFFMYWFSKQWMRQKMFKQNPALTDEELAQTYADYLKLANESEKRQQYRTGVRYTFLALLFYLESKEMVRIQKWKTNWDYVNEINEHSEEWSEVFQYAARLFDQVWYGNASIDEQAFLTYKHRIERNIKEGDGYGQME